MLFSKIALTRLSEFVPKYFLDCLSDMSGHKNGTIGWLSREDVLKSGGCFRRFSLARQLKLIFVSEDKSRPHFDMLLNFKFFEIIRNILRSLSAFVACLHNVLYQSYGPMLFILLCLKLISISTLLTIYSFYVFSLTWVVAGCSID